VQEAAPVIRAIALNLITMLLSLSVHEYSHARVAEWLGDDTPRRQGRLTLSPGAHYDVFGTFIVPVFAALFSPYALIGWARPVQTQPTNYTRNISMRRGLTLVAIAGPASNLVLAVLAAVLLGVLAGLVPDAPSRTDTFGALTDFFATLLWVNVGLCIFNLIPLPPLDGSRLLPSRFDEFQAQVAPFSIFIILLILNVPVLRDGFVVPVEFIALRLQQLAVTLRMGLM
jgi:Zn-dependent protease